MRIECLLVYVYCQSINSGLCLGSILPGVIFLYFKSLIYEAGIKIFSLGVKARHEQTTYLMKHCVN